MCTAKHTGTSASAPIAAAIIALGLEANYGLTWRDVQHILVRTSQKHNLNALDWKQNGVGRWFSGRYGYGLMDAGAIVETAKDWINAPPQEMIFK
jgi:furin